MDAAYGSDAYYKLGNAELVRGVLAFISAPVIGSLSDRHGRRALFVACVLGTAAPAGTYAPCPIARPVLDNPASTTTSLCCRLFSQSATSYLNNNKPSRALADALAGPLPPLTFSPPPLDLPKVIRPNQAPSRRLPTHNNTLSRARAHALSGPLPPLALALGRTVVHAAARVCADRRCRAGHTPRRGLWCASHLAPGMHFVAFFFKHTIFLW